MDRRLSMALIALLMAAAVSGCTVSSADTGLATEWSVRGNDPVSVVEGYFAAWEHGEPGSREDLVDTSLVKLSDEPPTSIERLNVFVTQGDSHRAICEAAFELAQVVDGRESGDTPTVERSEHTWAFELTFYEDRGSYVITSIERD